MILILSSSHDHSTNKVIDWLNKLGANWIRIDDQQPIQFQIQIDQAETRIQLRQGDKKISLKDIKAYWYRKGNFKIEWNFPTEMRETLFAQQIYGYLIQEIKSIKSFLHTFLEGIPGLGNYLLAEPNKLKVLSIARSVGLNIPTTIVSNNPNLRFPSDKKWITKATWEALHCLNESVGSVQAYTQEVTTKMQGTRFPSLFQESIEKWYEVRCFYLDGKTYSMAIFSQEDRQTSVDFRRYNFERPNRSVAYQIPSKEAKKLHQLMTRLQLITGSIDLIRAKNGRYYFLEVNPVGQFGMVSRPCYYPIEQLIAQYLIQCQT
jgi:ATP-GRASP peptide maturase of grasp-with-spasm system